MKKVKCLLVLLAAGPLVQAQNYFDPMKDSGYMFDLTHILATIAVIVVLSAFILSLVKLFFDHRIKKRLIEKGSSEDIVSQLVIPATGQNRATAIKWTIIFAGIGTGIALIDFFRPFGLHSLAIMCFCIAASFLVYYFLVRKSDQTTNS